MLIYSPTLFIEINKSDYTFVVGDEDENKNFKIIYKYVVPLQGVDNNQITDFDLTFNTIKNNIYSIEQKINFIFKESVLIINNFNCSFINLTGFKKLNGSQILKENITYILNSLKSNIDELEKKKTILHIFNSKYFLDKKKIENLPIGLFGDFYAHELSFCLINNNDYKNLNNIFEKCNLKIKKILFKSFAENTHISDTYLDHDTFFYLQMNEKNSQITYCENDALKFEQIFDFGSDLIVSDICKVTSLKRDIVKKIINSSILNKISLEDELIEKDFFKNENYIKIKKKLLLDIAEARIKELLDKLLISNINLKGFSRKEKVIFLTIKDISHFKCFKNSYFQHLSKNNNFTVKSVENISTESLMSTVNKLVNFGWKKEAVPVINPKKSLIARFFSALFD